MKTDVYRCLHSHKETWSIRSRETEDYGKVRTHTPGAIVKNATFVVQDGGRTRALKEGQKNVHAMVRGVLVAKTDEIRAPDVKEKTSVMYRPEWGEFRSRLRIGITKAHRVLFFPDGECVAVHPTLDL